MTEFFNQISGNTLMIILKIIVIFGLLLYILKLKNRIKRSENEIDTLLSMSKLGLCITDIEGKILMANPVLSEKFGIPPDKLKGKLFQRLFPEGQSKSKIDAMKRVVESGIPEIIQVRLFDGWSEIEIHSFAGFIRSQKALIFYITDITQWMDSQFELQNLFMTIEQLEEMIVITDEKGFIKNYNSAFARFHGYLKHDDLIEQNINILKTSEDGAEVRRAMRECITNGKGWKGNLTNKKKDGTLYSANVTISPVKDQEGSLINFISVIRDRTEELKSIQTKREKSRMDTVKTISAGVAHEFNNYLMKITGLSEVLASKLKTNTDVLLGTSMIIGEAHKAANVAARLLDLTRENEGEYIPVKSINSIIRLIVEDQKDESPDSLITDLDLSDDLRPVIGTYDILYKVFNELYLNSLEASEENGRIDIVSRNISNHSQEHTDAHYNLDQRDYVYISISDTGEGVEYSIQEKVFDPYFTTHEMGRGMGLSFVFSFIQRTDSRIYLESKKGEGTTVHLFIPAV